MERSLGRRPSPGGSHYLSERSSGKSWGRGWEGVGGGARPCLPVCLGCVAQQNLLDALGLYFSFFSNFLWKHMFGLHHRSPAYRREAHGRQHKPQKSTGCHWLQVPASFFQRALRLNKNETILYTLFLCLPFLTA